MVLVHQPSTTFPFRLEQVRLEVHVIAHHNRGAPQLLAVELEQERVPLCVCQRLFGGLFLVVRLVVLDDERVVVDEFSAGPRFLPARSRTGP